MPREWTNKGHAPRDKTVPLGIRWANNVVSRHSYLADQLKWNLRGWDHDIKTYWRTNGADDVEGERV